MTETTNKEIAESAETSDVENQQETVSDGKLLLAPLAKYGVIAILIVSAIVTTTIMLNRDMNTVDDEIATIEAEINQQNLVETNVEATAVEQAVSEISTVAQTTTELVSPALTPVVVTNETVAPEAEIAIAETTAPVTVSIEKVTPVFTADVAPQEYKRPAFNHKQRIAEQHALIAKQDQEYLDSFKTRQAGQIEWLKDQLARQQKRIEDIEKRNQETYEMRAASIKRMQQAREQSLDRI